MFFPELEKGYAVFKKQWEDIAQILIVLQPTAVGNGIEAKHVF